MFLSSFFFDKAIVYYALTIVLCVNLLAVDDIVGAHMFTIEKCSSLIRSCHCISLLLLMYCIYLHFLLSPAKNE